LPSCVVIGRDWVAAPDVVSGSRPRGGVSRVVRIISHAHIVRVALESAICGVSDSLIRITSRSVPVQDKIIVGRCVWKRDGGVVKTPPGKVIVNISVSVAVPLQGSFVTFVALMMMGNTPVAVGVPEISPGVQPSELLWQTVKPPGKSVASKLVGLLSAVI